MYSLFLEVAPHKPSGAFILILVVLGKMNVLTEPISDQVLETMGWMNNFVLCSIMNDYKIFTNFFWKDTLVKIHGNIFLSFYFYLVTLKLMCTEHNWFTCSIWNPWCPEHIYYHPSPWIHMLSNWSHLVCIHQSNRILL